MHQGSCLCGTVRYEITADIKRITHCHCSMCRKAHGAAFGSYATVPHSDFRFTEGAQSVASFQSSPTVTRTFCKTCGSTFQWFSQTDHPDMVGIAVGTLDTPLETISQQDIFTESKADWSSLGTPASLSSGS